MPSPRPHAPRRVASDGPRVLFILGALAMAIAVPVGVVSGVEWLDLPGSWSAGRPVPSWVTSGEVRATTRDGTLVKVRVAFDAGSNATKSAVQRRLREIGLLLEVSIGAHSTGDIAGTQGIARLSADMLLRVNAYLGADGVEPVRAVAIQDLWYTRP